MSARVSFFGSLGLAFEGGMADALLVSDFLSKRHSAALTAFNVAVWKVIRHYASTRARVDDACALAGRISETAALGLAAALPSPALDPQSVIDLANNPPDDAVVGFTDGSRLDTGQSGAGVFICPQNGFPKFTLSICLGRNSNNVAELYALGRACVELEVALAVGRCPPDTRVLLFSDSSYAINAVVKGWGGRIHRSLVRWARGKYRALKAVCDLELRWVRGHTGVTGNEEADVLAGHASARSVDDDGDHLLELDSIDAAYPVTPDIPPEPD